MIMGVLNGFFHLYSSVSFFIEAFRTIGRFVIESRPRIIPHPASPVINNPSLIKQLR